MSFYEFKVEDAERFVREHGGEAKHKGKELVFKYCPFCRGGKKPDKYTFAINLETGRFNCQRGSCGRKGNMITLSQEFDFELSGAASHYYNFTDSNMNTPNGSFRRFKDAHKQIISKDGAIQYMKSRGISEEVCRKYEITIHDTDKQRIVFPFKDEDGKIQFVKYRNTDPERIAKGSKEFCEPKCMPILFGMNHCQDYDRLVITEGQIDSLSLTEAGVPNAVSVPTGKNGFTWVPHCWDFVKKFKEIVCFGDCENGEVTLSAELTKRFKNVKVVQVEDYLGCKDANEILQKHGAEALRKAVDNATSGTLSHIKEMADVESLDIESLPAISTGTGPLNEILSGGFHYGDFVILTGRRGDGKSTMASQFTVEALAKDHNCLIYSGEMKDVAVKNWIDRQIVGRQVPYNSEIKACEKWYRGRLFIYDDEVIDEEETETLLETVEDAIVQKNVRFVLIDNLMTAMEDTAGTNEALYRQQSNFCGKLAKLARKFEVVIMLICHPRKTSNENLMNDDVSGSADITNKANIVLTYSRVYVNKQEQDPKIRDLAVTKNRLTGKTGTVKMIYSEGSKRICWVKSKDLPRNYLAEELTEDIEEEDLPFQGD